MGFWDWVWGKKDDDQRPAVAAFPAPPAPPLPAQAVAPSPPPVPPAPPVPPVPTLSIEGAIKLMRALPLDDDPDLVMSVVRKTLRSTGLSVEGIVGAAKEQENALSASIAKDGVAIEQMELEIAARRANIERTRAQLAETRGVRERLQEAIQNESRVGPSLVAPAEIARLQAEAAASAKPPPPSSKNGPAVPPPLPDANAEPAPAPKSPSLAVPKPSAPPLPKTGAPPAIPKKSLAPKLQVALPSNSTKPPAPRAPFPNTEMGGVVSAPPVAAREEASTSLPSLSDDADGDVHSEETAKFLSDAPGGPSVPER